ncbi:MAG TPA: hypothetical protein VJU86_19875 [Pyrinomonadaceae bacterium]|nr:hypothetical protein [Pyrinomonadaceae bacterium]
MDRVAGIIRYEWRAYWRRFVRAGLRGGNQAIVLIFALIVAAKYLQLLTTAATRVSNGNTQLLGSLLTALFLTWLFPVASSQRETIASRKWLHLPLTHRERFIVRSASLLLAPSAWLVVAGSLAICFPLAYTRQPLAGVVAGLLFIGIAWATGLTISHLLHSAFWRRVFWFAGLTGLALAAVFVIKGGALRSLAALPFSPTVLVERAAMANTTVQTASSLALLATLLVVVVIAALWSFKKSLRVGSEGGSGKPVVLRGNFLAGHLGGLVAKDFRYFRKLLDVYLGVAAAILTGLYLVVAEVPSASVFWSFIVVVFLCNAALPFNSFGLDNGRGMARYTLLPLSGQEILFAKNLAYLLIVLVQIVPLLFIAGWRLGSRASALGLVEAATIACAYLTWGNWMSVNHPLKMQFYRFANSGAALVDAMGGIIFGTIPGIVLIYLWQGTGAGVVGMTALVVLLATILYFLSLQRYGGRFEEKREQVAAALTV